MDQGAHTGQNTTRFRFDCAAMSGSPLRGIDWHAPILGALTLPRPQRIIAALLVRTSNTHGVAPGGCIPSSGGSNGWSAQVPRPYCLSGASQSPAGCERPGTNELWHSFSAPTCAPRFRRTVSRVTTPTPDIVKFAAPRRRKVLSRSQVATLHEAVLEILAEVGVSFANIRALEIFSGSGASIDERGCVRIPAELVQRALLSAPRSFVLAGREERFDLLLDGKATYVCSEGVGVRVVDLDSGELRSSRKADVAMMARVIDALPLISFFWPPVSAQDYPSTAPLHECHAGLTNTLKHVRGGTAMPPTLARAVVEMATVVAGSEEARRRRPPICANICTVSPLTQDPNGIEAAFIYAEAGIPQSFMAMPTVGSTAPASIPAAIVMGEAEVVSALVLMQLAYPGCPVMHANLISLMDPHSGGYLSEVEFPFEAVVSQLSHDVWRVPDLGGASLSSDAALVDWVSGLRAGLGAALVPTEAAEICGYLGGLTAGSTILQPELIILQHEALVIARSLSSPLTFKREDLALDVLRDVGPGGHFLAHRHTRLHLHDVRRPLWQALGPARGDGLQGDSEVDPVAGRAARDGIGRSEALSAAKREFRRLARDHEPEPLPGDVLAELDAIVGSADKQMLDLVS